MTDVHDDPPLHAPARSGARMIRDERGWSYRDAFGRPVIRRLRVWRTDAGRITAVVTERGAGMSITEAAEQVTAQLAEEYPDHVVVVEHYPASAGAEQQEHFDLVEVVGGRPPRWRRIPLEAMTASFGPKVLDDEPTPPRRRVAIAVRPQDPPMAGPPPRDDVIFRGHGPDLVTVHDPATEAVSLLHHVMHRSPTGFAWGYQGSGPAELARCLLIAALGEDACCSSCAGTQAVTYTANGEPQPYQPGQPDPEVSRCPECVGGIRHLPDQAFKRAVVADWPVGSDWQITAGEIRQWLASHAAAHREDLI